MGLNKRGRKEDEGESSSSNYSSSDDDENADENNKTTTNVEEFGFERVEKLTGRRLKQEKLNKKKQKSGGFESMDLPPDIFRAIKRKGYRLPRRWSTTKEKSKDRSKSSLRCGTI